MPEFVECLRVVTEKGYPAIVITNQRGVALGNMTAETVERIHETLQKLLGENGLSLLDIFYCPHDNDSCDCRKPKPGMLLEAARRHELDLAGSWMIGDNEKDVQAGQAAGCTTVLVSETANPTVADFQVNAMDALAVLLKERLPEVGDSV